MLNRQPKIVLNTARTPAMLRPFTASDAMDVVLAKRDPLVRHYAGYLLDDRSAALGAITRWNDAWHQGEGAAWAIEVGSQLTGFLRFGLQDESLGTASVGYWLLPEGRGLGLITAGLQAGTRFVFDRLGWHRIELYHAVENERSCAVAKRCGYQAEGVMREAMRYPHDGRWSDEHLHARLATDPDPR